MRLFLAIDLDDPARAAASAWSQALSTRLGTAAAREIKWVEPANLHLSLHFFGELDDVRRDAVTRALGAPFATRAFAIALTGAGVFPPTGAPRVIWLGIRDSAESSAHTIYREVQARLTPLGLQETTTTRVHTASHDWPRPHARRRAGTPASRRHARHAGAAGIDSDIFCLTPDAVSKPAVTERSDLRPDRALSAACLRRPDDLIRGSPFAPSRAA